MIKVGFVGLGRIGKPMAVNVLKAGFDLSVYDLRTELVKELAELGAKAARSLEEVAEGADVIELAVVDDAQVEEVLVGSDALIDGAGFGTVVVIHSTVHPETVKRVARIAAAKGVHVIDAPISGGENGARERSLCYMVGGEQTLVERCRDLFSTSASEIFHMGALGSGAAAKMIVQVVTCINMLAAHEAEILAGCSGLNFAALQKVIRVSSAQSFVADQWIDRFKRPQDPIEIRLRRTEVFQKSLAPAIETAQRLGLSLSGAFLAERLLPQIIGIEES